MNETDLVPLEGADKESFYAGAFIGAEPGRLTCYFGYRPQTITEGLFCYALSVGFSEKHDGSSDRFIKLVRGALLWAHKPRSQSTQQYYAPNCQLVLPRGTQCYFSISSRSSQEDKNLTELAFGFVQSDLVELVNAYCKATDMTGHRVGRVTFSKSRDNKCDLTGVAIPREFPYLTFAEPNQNWAHISLFGFYSHLGFLLNNGRSSPLYAALLDAGAKVEWLERAREIPARTIGTQVMLHDPQ